MSRPQVTITLGRSGQVVKRPGQGSEGGRSDQVRPSGGKRSIRERLGSNADNPSLYSNQSRSKRQRRESKKWSSSDDDIDDGQIGRDDLRFKLMRKNVSRGTRSDGEGHNMDLRQKLSRTEHSAMVATHSYQHMPEPKANGLVRRIPPTRSADDLHHMDSLRKSYSSWALDGLRRRSSERILVTSRGLSPPRNMDGIRPPRNMDGIRQGPPMRPVDASRPPYMGKDIVDSSRSTGPIHYMKPSVALDPAKPVARLPPPNGIMQKPSYMGEEPHTVASLLHSLGLGKYGILFQAEEGPRKKILLAVKPPSKRQP
ncbi:uncharacterized protein LOC122079738 isoform X2 [Macadamia integrifolia]|uniref:uncharacterized protein LOC122079738 isoform X2 n=1 Tax=Macadamia integrifolia TaxID=60698 RepID=UPI001C4F3FE3|nr:uncharacterized protein LOC122079738 isoform X2 [Macadamia integrifolia]